jgi:adenylate cyclase
MVRSRLADRTSPAGLSAVVEDRHTVVRIVTWILVGSILSASVQAAAFFTWDEPLVGWSSVALGIAYLGALAAFALTGSVLLTAAIALMSSTVDIALVHLALGGYANSGATFMWSTLLVVNSVLIFRRRLAFGLGAFYLTAAIVFGFLEQALRAGRPPPNPALPAVLFASVAVGIIALVLLILFLLLTRLRSERERSESLLLNVLPSEVATELKERGVYKARRYDEASVLFADLVGFTPMAASVEPEDTVAQLNEVFTQFDAIADRHGVEKIRTIGDAYVAVAGVPSRDADHAASMARMALDMLAYAEGTPYSFRVGISSGPVVAGVIGRRKFQYDLWGDTVNLASRMESSSEPGRIQITESTYNLINKSFEVTPRGPTAVKGKGSLNTWWLTDVQ